MTGAFGVFSTYQSATSTHNVTCSEVSDLGTTHLSPDMSLSFVLFVPQFSFSLLFINKITRSLNCFVTFYSSHCVLKDLKTKRKIGTGHEAGELYYFDFDSPTRALQTSSSPFSGIVTLDIPFSRI